MNNGNLRPLTTEEAREIGKAGGMVSGKKRQEKKAMQEIWEAVRSMPIREGERSELEEIKSVARLKGANITVGQAIVLALAKKAMKGDVRAFETLSRLTENAKRSEEIKAEMAVLELEKLRIEVDAFRRYEAKTGGDVVIVDDISN